jgi:hypothetical protein
VMQLALTPSDLDALRGLCRGVLRACGSLTLDLRACFKEDTVALMAVLSQGWQPSAEALQPIRSSSIDSHQAARHWSLELCTTPLSRQCLELLPKGLSVLNLRWVPCQWLYAKSYVWPTCTWQPYVCLYLLQTVASTWYLSYRLVSLQGLHPGP